MPGRITLKKLIIFTFISGFISLNAKTALAVDSEFPILPPTEPSFPACSNPQGTQIASFSDGTHGIPGNANTFFGDDQVNILSDSTLVQCFCPQDGEMGIQTNWWKASELSTDEIGILQQMGWVYIPDGSAWGLDPVPYLAKNSDFTCKGRGGSNGGSSSSSDKNDKHKASKGAILGLSVLPATGNLPKIFALSGLTLVLFGAALMVNKRS